MSTEQEPSVVLTRDAHDRLQQELDRLTTTGRTEIAAKLLKAREDGDLRENAEYDAAKNAQGLMEARIRELQRLLKHAEITDGPASTDEATPGIIVTLRPLDEEEPEDERYLLAASKEERHDGARTVSISSPLGKALLGKRIGEHVSYEAPGGTFSYEVVALEPRGA